jgi:hypothetical protein
MFAPWFSIRAHRAPDSDGHGFLRTRFFPEPRWSAFSRIQLGESKNTDVVGPFKRFDF